MFTIWIIHRDAHHRAALARIAGLGDNAVLGGPLDRLFESASRPSAVLLGLGDDFEHELEFVHRFGPRLAGCPWVVLAPKADLAEARRLFDTLRGRFLAYPPSPVELRRALRDALRRRTRDRLSVRQEREALRDRFTRWFADVDLPELMRAIDPRMANVPVLIRGEEGTGRGILARYIHTFGGGPDEGFVPVSCRGLRHADELLGQIESGVEKRDAAALTIWLEDVDLLPLSVQRRLQGWVEYRPLDGALRADRIRWIAGAGDEADLEAEPGLEPRLAESFAGLTLRIPALRERPESIDGFVAETSRAWASQRGERIRQWSPDALMLLRAYPWPGNVHELEAVVIRTLSFTGADPVLPVHLRFPGDSGWLDRYAEETPTPPAPRVVEEPEPRLAETELPEATILPEEDELEVVLGTLEEAGEDEIGEEAITPAASLDEIGEIGEIGEAREAEPAAPTRPGAPPTGTDATAAATTAPAPEAPAPSAYEMADHAMQSVLPPAAPEHAPGAGVGDDEAERSDWRQLVRALVHDVRNPLVSIRTFSELLPDHYDDAEFRSHFSELVGRDVVRIDDAISRLQEMVDLSQVKSEPVDVAQLLERLLDELRDDIQARRLLVLKELDHSLPHALGDPLLLRDAFSGLIKRAIASVADRGDIYIASRHHVSAQAGRPTLRVLIRYGTEPGAGDVAEGAHLDAVMAQSIVHSLGGTFTEDTTDADECVIVIDLPAPA
jgi:DNA-binding NtrC family response regulator